MIIYLYLISKFFFVVKKLKLTDMWAFKWKELKTHQKLIKKKKKIHKPTG